MLDIFAGHDFGVFYVVSQVFALLSLLLNLYAVQRKKKAQILNYNVVAAICGTFHYLFLGAWPGVASKLVGTARNSVAAYEAHRGKISRIWPVIFVSFYIIGGIMTYSSFISILPIVASVIYAIVIYVGSASNIRYAATISSSLWLIYNVFVFSIVGIFSETVFIIDALVAIYRYRRHKKKTRRKKK
jgi:hypothetical protein